MENGMSRSIPQLIVMLTHNDYTVENAEEVFEEGRGSRASFWGMKEHPLLRERMKNLYARMKKCGKTTALEVVGYDFDSAMKGAELAKYCGCDILMGTKFYDSISKFCRENGILYFPFVGNIVGRPSVLSGSIDEIIDEARDVIARGADGVDLLGYRYVDDAEALIAALVKSVDAPVCIAGSIDSYQRLDSVCRVSPHSFTIGSAFFNNCFGGSISEQIDKVIGYIDSKG